MVGTRQIMYFLVSLFSSKKSHVSLSWLVPSTSVGNVNYFLQWFVTIFSFSRIWYILVLVSLSFVFSM